MTSSLVDGVSVLRMTLRACEVDNLHYLPLNLPTAFKRNGLQVQVQFRERDDYGSICIVGPVVEILSIESH